MDRFTSGLVAAAAVAMTAFLSVSPAQARGVVIDGPTGDASWQPQTICIYGQACGGITLGFDIDVGKGLTNKLFIYDNGLVSVGSELVASFDPSTSDVIPVNSLADLAGQDAFTPFLAAGEGNFSAPYVPLGPLEYQAIYGVIDANTADYSYAAFNLKQTAGNPGAFTLTFMYGDTVFPAPDFTRGAWGYQFGSLSEGDTVYGDDIVRSFNLGSAEEPVSPGVPEPSTWAMLILGLGSVGATLRRRRAANLPPEVLA